MAGYCHRHRLVARAREVHSMPHTISNQEELWQDLFSNPSQWFDNRLGKRSPNYPDFRHKSTKQPLWLDNRHKPSWVDPRLQQSGLRCLPSLPAAEFASAMHLDVEIQDCRDASQLSRAMDALLSMDQHGIVPTEQCYRSLLRLCKGSKSLPDAVRVKTHLLQHRPDMMGCMGEYMVMTLARCGGLEEALNAFNCLPQRTVFSWTAVISAYTDRGECRKALDMYQYMRGDGVEPNEYTFVSLLKACGSLTSLKDGEALHAEAKRKGIDSEVFVGSTLLSMYGKLGKIMAAENVFMDLSKRNVVSWNAMLTTYVEQYEEEKALKLYRQMEEEGNSSNELTIMIALQACCLLSEKDEAVAAEEQSTKASSFAIGQGLHAGSLCWGFCLDSYIGSMLIRLYGKCENIAWAESIFVGSSHRDVVLWTVMLSAYVEQGEGQMALRMYTQMQKEGVKPEKQTLVMALQACCALAESEETTSMEGQTTKSEALGFGQALHDDAQKMGFHSDVFVGSALVSMYSKCGSILEAEDCFRELSGCDIVSWNGMLSAYVEHGYGEKALQIYQEMQLGGLTLTDISVLCILQACSDTGSVDICRQIHVSVTLGVHNLSAIMAALIHAYGSCGSMMDAQAVFDASVEPDMVSWSALIAGYAREGDCALSLQTVALMQFAGIKPDRVTFLSLLLACSHSGLVDSGLGYFESMARDYGVSPDLKHFVSLFDLLGRAGNFTRVEDVLASMPSKPDAAVWLSLLAACQNHGNVDLGIHAFNFVVHLQPMEAAPYVLMSNIYANAGLYDCADQVERTRQSRGAGRSCTRDNHDVLSWWQ